MTARRPVLTDPDVLTTLAHPVRLDVLSYLMSEQAATASACARAIGDTPSNCSYHLRVLARHGLVEPEEAEDGRERPWRATITGFDIDATGEQSDPEAVAALFAASLQREQRLTRDYLTHRDRVSAPWRESDACSSYTLRATAAELRALVAALDGLIRPLIAATRDHAPAEAELVHLGLQAFPWLAGE